MKKSTYNQLFAAFAARFHAQADECLIDEFAARIARICNSSQDYVSRYRVLNYTRTRLRMLSKQVQTSKEVEKKCTTQNVSSHRCHRIDRVGVTAA